MRKFICDHCKCDLSITTNSKGWRLSLINERMPSMNGAVSDMYIYPPIPDGNGGHVDKHFCGLGCLKAWIQLSEEDRHI